jgi:hypothetical protein
MFVLDDNSHLQTRSTGACTFGFLRGLPQPHAGLQEDASESDSEGEMQADDNDDDDGAVSSSSEAGELPDKGAASGLSTPERTEAGLHVLPRGDTEKVLPEDERCRNLPGESSLSNADEAGDVREAGGCASSDSEDDVHWHGEEPQRGQHRQGTGGSTAPSGQRVGASRREDVPGGLGEGLPASAGRERDDDARVMEFYDKRERTREPEEARAGAEGRTAVQQRVIAEARRVAQQQIAAQSARGAHKATSKNRRQESRRQTPSKNSGW